MSAIEAELISGKIAFQEARGLGSVDSKEVWRRWPSGKHDHAPTS